MPVLVVTPTSGLGDFVRQTLRETGEYEVVLERSARAALRQAASYHFALAILDADLPDMALTALMDALRQENPGTRFLLLTSENHPGLQDDPAVLAVFRKPFYLPDLLEAIRRGAEPRNALPPEKAAPSLWQPAFPVEDSAPLVRPLVRGENASPFSREMSPPPWLGDVEQAARHLMRLSLESAAQAAMILRGETLWAYAGGLSQPAAHELSHTVARHWASGSGSDLARFIRLGATGSEYMLYATGLGGSFVLALVFDAETPFSEIRLQAGSLARALAEKPAPPPPGGETDAPRETPSQHVLPPEKMLQAELPPETVDFSALEGDNRWVARPSGASRPAGQGEAEGPQVETIPQETEAPARETVPQQEGRGEGIITLEPESPAVYHLKYACVLLPRLPGHYLTGDLAGRLSEWVGQLCLAFAWRLEYIAIRPDHLHWIVSVPPDTSPSYLMRILRQHTSQRIFAAFPALAEENPSGDFWAPGYLIMGSSQPAPPQLIRDFIRQTRRHQGIG